MYDERTTEWRGVLEDLEKRKDGLGLVIPPKDKSRILAAPAANASLRDDIVGSIDDFCSTWFDSLDLYSNIEIYIRI